MTFDNLNNQKSVTELRNATPDWLESFGNKFDMGIVVFSADGSIIYRNQKFFSHFDLPKSVTSQSRNIRDWMQYLIERGDFQKNASTSFIDEAMTAVTGNSTDDLPFNMATPPNGKILKLAKFIPFENMIAIISEDITEKTQNQNGLDMALEMGRSGYFHYSFDTRKLEMFGSYLKNILTSAEYRLVSNKGFWPIIHKDEIEGIQHEWRKTISRGSDFQTTARIQTEKHGTLWMKCTAKTQFNHSDKVSQITGFIEDVTEQYKIHSELQQAKEKMESALKSKTLFLARISHEIRTPMNAVIGIADALIHHNNNPEITPKLELIQSSAGNILNTLGDTLNHSELESDGFSLDKQLGNPIKVIENACALWTEKATENKTTLHCHIDKNVPDEITFDRYRYEQCINNLLSNAIKFCESGKIEVFSTLVKTNGIEKLILAVKDSGIGMTKEQQTRIFEPFQQGDRSISRKYGGSGLGMNITKQIIQMMGGSISVKSEIGKGTIFALSLPLETQRDAEKLEPESMFDQLMGKDSQIETPYQKLKILIADDNQTNHIVIKSLLGSMVAEIYTANDGKEVLEVLEVQEIDIVLMDIHMPVMDGIEATIAIRSSNKPWSDIMIIAVTADPQYQQQRLCLNIGMNHAVAKPVKLMDLLEGIDHVLELKNNRGEIRKVS